jgi:hypothetical protein
LFPEKRGVVGFNTVDRSQRSRKSHRVCSEPFPSQLSIQRAVPEQTVWVKTTEISRTCFVDPPSHVELLDAIILLVRVRVWRRHLPFTLLPVSVQEVSDGGVGISVCDGISSGRLRSLLSSRIVHVVSGTGSDSTGRGFWDCALCCTLRRGTYATEIGISKSRAQIRAIHRRVGLDQTWSTSLFESYICGLLYGVHCV